MADAPAGIVLDSAPPGISLDHSPPDQAPTGISLDSTPKYGPDDIKALWLKHGGDPKAADMMAKISGEENGSGDPTLVNPKGGASGLFQILPAAHGKANWTDPNVNVQKAIELYNARKKAGGTGFEDWEDSKDKGAHGGWGKYLMQHQDAQTPHDKVPLPPNIKEVNKPANADPRKANYNILEAFAGHQELPFMLANAKMWDAIDKTGGSHEKEMWDLWKPSHLGGKGNPGAASALYGMNSPEMLKVYARSGNPVVEAYGKALAANPMLAGATTFVQEFFNPLAWAEGGLAGKGAGMAMKGVRMVPGVNAAVTAMQHALSSYGGLVQAHGEGPRNVLAGVGQRMTHSEEAAHEKMVDVFHGTTEDEQLEIRRRQQNLPPKDFGSRNEALDVAAKKARDLTRDATAAKLAVGALTKDQVHGVRGSAPTTVFHEGKSVAKFEYDPGTYVGLKNQYMHPNPAFNKVLEELEIRSRGGTPSIKSKTYDNLDEAAADREGVGPSLLRGDIDHAESLKNFLSTSGKRVEFEKGMRELSQRHPEVIKVPASAEERQALMNSGQYIPLADVKHSGIDTKNQSAFMQQAMVSPAFDKFLNNKNSMSAILGKSLVERGIYSDNPAVASAEKFMQGFNHIFRSTIVANPGYHPFWNVATNATAATGKLGPAGLPDMMLNYTRAILGTGATVLHGLGHVPVVGNMTKPLTGAFDTARQGLEHPFLMGSKAYNDAMHVSLEAARKAASDEAGHYGAHAEFGAPSTALGGSPGRIFTRGEAGKFKPTWDNPREAFDQMITRMDRWNSEGTFGERGEKAFSTTLFHQLYSDTNRKTLFYKDPYGAAWAVREALGNYRNINPENWMSKAILFFPWLASNVPFWFKTFLKTPQFATAPVQASRTQRENAGDPTAYEATYPKTGISVYHPEDQSHQDIPLPLKDAERFAQSAYDAIPTQLGGQGNIDQAIKEAFGEIASRAKPLQGAAIDTGLTTYDERANPQGSYVGYNVMFNKDQPDQKETQLAQSIGLNIAPLPVPFVSREILRNGYDGANMNHYLQEAAGMGYISTKTADSYKRVQQHAQSSLEAGIKKINKIQSVNPLTEDQKKAYINKLEAAYATRMNGLKAAVEANKKKKGAASAPPGIILDH